MKKNPSPLFAPPNWHKIKAGPFGEGGGMACDEDESMDVDVDRNEVNVDENEMDVPDVVQVEGRKRRFTIVVSNGGWWVTCTTVITD